MLVKRNELTQKNLRVKSLEKILLCETKLKASYRSRKATPAEPHTVQVLGGSQGYHGEVKSQTCWNEIDDDIPSTMKAMLAQCLKSLLRED